MIKPPNFQRSVSHCQRCSEFTDQLTGTATLNQSTKDWLQELWYEHQDRADDMRCWNAWCSIFDPAKVVDIEKMEAESNAAAEAAEKAQYEKLKEKFDK